MNNRFKVLVTPALAECERTSYDFHRLSESDACPLQQFEAVKACDIAEFKVWLAWAKATTDINPGMYKELMSRYLRSGTLKTLSPADWDLVYRLCDRQRSMQLPVDCIDVSATRSVGDQLKKLSGIIFQDYLPYDVSMVINLTDTTTPIDRIMSLLDIENSSSKNVKYLRVLIPNISNDNY